MKILCTTSSFDAPIPPDFDVVKNPHGRTLTEEMVRSLIIEHRPDGIIAGVEPLTRRVLEAAATSSRSGGPMQPGAQGRLKVISRCGVGLDGVDLSAASDLGIEVRNTPSAPVPSVAELTIGLILAALRSIPIADAAIRRGDWPRLKGGLLGARTVGIVGCGRIGTAVAGLIVPFGSRVLGFDPAIETHETIRLVPLDQLLAESDVVTLHAPLLDSTRHIIDGGAFAKMKPSAILVNTARGALVDEKALVDALKCERIAGCALDVYEDEPYIGPLTDLPEKTVLTAHMASSARETRDVMEREAVANLVAVLGEVVLGEK